MSVHASEERLNAALRNAEEFFTGESKVQQALDEISASLAELRIPYALAGAMALNAYGYERVTTDIDLILTQTGLAAFKEAKLGRGYVEKSTGKFPGSVGIRDTAHGVDIDILLAGRFPGDGKAKPISFPDPRTLAVEGSHRVVPLTTLVELKLASGMTAPHRLKDLADVLELIRARGLPSEFGESLHPYVRAKFEELHAAAQGATLE